MSEVWYPARCMAVYRYVIVGYGNVGRALAEHVEERADRLAAVYGLEMRLAATVTSKGELSPDDLAALAPDCVAVCLPTNRETGEPGLSWSRGALAAGAGVVLADKGPALLALPELEAARRGRFVGASATVGSALPTLALARRELAGAEIREISAILNGTSNMILTHMRERDASFADALAEAQRLGIAEPDPSYDVEGWDTAVKLTILARSLVDRSVSLADVDRRGIDALDPALVDEARATGGRIRLVGRARRDAGRTRLAVAPEAVAPDDPFFLVEGATKAARFVTDDLGTLVVTGGASGRRDVAAAMLKDMLSDPRIHQS
jgi:homoserine dehydrogenase